MRKEKGITLIALVITIIVLLILAGVAISMLSGENGILKKAAEAKTKTEESQVDELSKLLSYEMAMKNTNGKSSYKYQNGYITGINCIYDSDTGKIKTTQTVKQLEDELPEGYKISLQYNDESKEDQEIASEDTLITTGMAIVKDKKIIARTVVFGDVNCDGEVTLDDGLKLGDYCNFYENLTDFQKIAGNLCNDNELNDDDYQIIVDWSVEEEVDTDQNRIINIDAKNIKRLYTELQQYINSLDKSSIYSFEYNNETDTYKLKGVKKDTLVSELINALPKSEELKILNNNGKKVANDSKVISGYYLVKKINSNSPKFAYIEIEE